jgi:hypothetical protein
MDREQDVQRILETAKMAARTSIKGMGLLLALLLELERALGPREPEAFEQVPDRCQLRLIKGGKE